MRPGQLTPENVVFKAIQNGINRLASMRPGQLTPENVAWHYDDALDKDASMRPGQLTPENIEDMALIRRYHRCFNEAGAINPGKPGAPRRGRIPCRRFNEAGAINPGKPNPPSPRSARMRSFNEAGAINPGKPDEAFVQYADLVFASMRPGQLTPENYAASRDHRQLCQRASMRPGQLTPENTSSSWGLT